MPTFMKWADLLGTLKRSSQMLGDTNPNLMQAYRGLATAQGSNGALDAKTRELIAMAVAVRRVAMGASRRMPLQPRLRAPPKRR